MRNLLSLSSSDITFKAANSTLDLLFQAYCLNPPPDSCPYGPCPNPDVTGIGQQFSVYTAATAFCIALVYCPGLVRPMLCAHLFLVYSLMISACIALFLGELTQNDGLFVLVTVASPASIYLWITAALSFRWPATFPGRSHSSALEHSLFRLLSLISLLFEVGMICIMLLPQDSTLFSQPACNARYGYGLWVDLLWEMPYAVQLLWILFASTISKLLFQLTESRANPSKDADIEHGSRQISDLDLIRWTEENLRRWRILDMQKPLSAAIIASIQLIAIPNIGVGTAATQNVLVISIIAFGIIGSPMTSETAQHCVITLYRILALGTAMGFYALARSLHSVPMVPDLLVVAVSLTAHWTSASNKISSFWARQLLFPLISMATLTCSVIPWSYWVGKIGLKQSIQQVICGTQTLHMNLLNMSTWFVAWLSLSVWKDTGGHKVSLRDVWDATVYRGHILKANLLVVTPNALWIRACIASSPTPSTRITYGQVFAIITSLICVTSFLDELNHMKAETWLAVWRSEPLPEEKCEEYNRNS